MNSQRQLSPLSIGVICGALSAILYTITNICLRYVAEVDAVWVSTIKALPTLFIVVPIVWFQAQRSSQDQSGASRLKSFNLVSRREVFWLVVTSIGTQIFGNVAFQVALSILGLSISVPIVLGTMLIGGAISGWLMLGEPVSTRKWLSVVVLILATIVLCNGAATPGVESDGLNAGSMEGTGYGTILLGLCANIASGLAYAIQGTVMRRSMQRGMSVASTLMVISSSGWLFLCAWSFVKLGVNGIVETSWLDFGIMLLAGIFNALAFLAMAKSLQQVSVLLVQLLNASQAAISALAGWMLFGERITLAIGCGLVLTVIGLLVAGAKDEGSQVLRERKSTETA